MFLEGRDFFTAEVFRLFDSEHRGYAKHFRKLGTCDWRDTISAVFPESLRDGEGRDGHES
jgi:hypothetical protein